MSLAGLFGAKPKTRSSAQVEEEAASGALYEDDAAVREIEAYLDRFELMRDPQLQPLEQDGKVFGKITYSGFSGYSDYEMS